MVSIIIPVYNAEKTIERCIQSVLEQTYEQLEVIMINDGSKDHSAEICEKLKCQDGRIRLYHQENQGVVAARSFGVSVASSEFITFIDSDDWVEKNYIENLMAHSDKADLVTSGFLKETAAGNQVKEHDFFDEKLYDDMEEIWARLFYDLDRDIFHPVVACICGKLFRTALLKKIHNTVPTGIKDGEDGVLLYKYLLQCNKIYVTHMCGYHYCYVANSASKKYDSHRLGNIDMIYNTLLDSIDGHLACKELTIQLQKMIVAYTCKALNQNMGFDNCCKIQKFMLDTSGLTGKKIVLYGAGMVGQDYKMQLVKMGYNLVGMADSNYCHYRELGEEILNLEELLTLDYDLIIVSVEREEVADRIEADLRKKGIEKEIIWKKPFKVF